MTKPHASTPPPNVPPMPLPFHAFASSERWATPSIEECSALWKAYAMPEHIRAHSQLVAEQAHLLAQRAVLVGINVHPAWVRASGLLHDLAKSYCIQYGGNHAQLGAAWVLAETKNPAIAQGVMHHVHWSWDIDIEQSFLPLAIIYADKRVKHDALVSLTERFEDLIERYGRTAPIRQRIYESYLQALAIEQALEARLGSIA